MIRQLFNILRPKALLIAAVVAAGCSDDNTADGGEMTFRNGDNLFECPATGGTKEISFFSRSGHWEITPEDPEASWIDVWPAYGDDNGRTTLTVEFPMGIHTVAMPDNSRRVAFFYGPVLLAAPLGEGEVQVYDIPCFVSEDGSATEAVQSVPGKPLHFTARTTSDPQLLLVPFYGLHGHKHAVYFDLFTPQEWAVREQEYREIIAAQQALEARTTDHFRIGEMQPERDHNLKSERSDAGNANGRAFRHAFDGWFSFEAEVDPGQPMQMICEFWGADRDKRNFDILVDGTLLRSVSLTGEHGPRFFEAVYDLPRVLTEGRERVTVCFRSHPGNYAGGLFGFRMVRKE